MRTLLASVCITAFCYGLDHLAELCFHGLPSIGVVASLATRRPTAGRSQVTSERDDTQNTSEVLDRLIEPSLESEPQEDVTPMPEMGAGACSECDCSGFHRGQYPDTCQCGHHMNLHY